MKYATILLLPVIVLYHFRKEERLGIRLLRCIQYGVIFLAIFILEYIVYFRDVDVFLAMMAQTERYCKSIYSGLYALGVTSKDLVTLADWNSIRIKLRNIVFLLFALVYVLFCINLLTTRKIKFYKSVRKYNIMLIFFLLSLSNFQQWYLVWLFPTIMWQKPSMIKNIIGISAATEIANSIYMFKIESWVYDKYFIMITVVTFLIWRLSYYKTNKIKENRQNN